VALGKIMPFKGIKSNPAVNLLYDVNGHTVEPTDIQADVRYVL
jgi:hypothetical protein